MAIIIMAMIFHDFPKIKTPHKLARISGLPPACCFLREVLVVKNEKPKLTHRETHQDARHETIGVCLFNASSTSASN